MPLPIGWTLAQLRLWAFLEGRCSTRYAQQFYSVLLAIRAGTVVLPRKYWYIHAGDSHLRMQATWSQPLAFLY